MFGCNMKGGGAIIHSVTSGMRLQNTPVEGGIKMQVGDIDHEISLMACVVCSVSRNI